MDTSETGSRRIEGSRTSPSRHLDQREESRSDALADANLTIAALKERRAGDLERLAELTRARDLLEGRLAAEAAKVAEALQKVEERDRLLGELNELGGAVLLAPEDGDDKSPERRSWLAGKRFSFWWRYTLGSARRAHAAGKLVEAQILFEAALLKREDLNALIQLGHVLRERKLFDAAESVYERVIDLDGKNAENQFLAGYCAEMAGRSAQAARHYDAALKLDPQLTSKYDHLRDYSARLFG